MVKLEWLIRAIIYCQLAGAVGMGLVSYDDRVHRLWPDTVQHYAILFATCWGLPSLLVCPAIMAVLIYFASSRREVFTAIAATIGIEVAGIVALIPAIQ